MTKQFAAAATLLPAITVMSALALSCSVANTKECWISSRTHEMVCMSTSDSAGKPYKDARPAKMQNAIQAMQSANARKKPKAIQAMEIAKAREKRAEARAKRWPYR